jgi:AraC-like DNA-binding protein
MAVVVGWTEQTLTELARADVPSFARGDRSVYWRDDAFFGVFSLGTQRPEDLEESWELFRSLRVASYVFADARRFRPEGTPGPLFEKLVRIGPSLAREFPRVERSVVVLPDDWTAVWWRGAATTLEWRDISVEVATSPEEAWARLPAPESLATSVERLTRAFEEADIVRATREALLDDPARRADQVARRLGLSLRALQRELASAGSSFVSLRVEARLERAVELLESSDEKLATIAERLGFRSRAHFGVWFRGRTGRAPSELRPRR